MQTLTITASVRPGRVAVLCDIADPEWMYSCRYILETFSTIWCGHANIIIPTDGRTIRPCFGKSSSNSTRTTSARPTLRHLEERDPAAFEAKIAEQLATWGEDYEPTQDMIDRVRTNLRQAQTSALSISAELVQQLKVRISPYFYQEMIVQPDAWTAGEIPRYPHTRVLNLLPEIDHADKINSTSPARPGKRHIGRESA